MTWSAPGPRNPSKDGIQRHDVSEPAIERFSVPAGQTPFNPPSDGRPQQDSNLRSRLRSPAARSSEFAASTCVDSIAHLACDGGNSAYIPDHGNCTVTACTLQGMARVRSGSAPAWPLVSGRSVRSGSRVKRDFPCTLTGALPPALVCPAGTVALEAGGAGTYTQRAIPGSEPSQNSCTFRWTWGRGPGGHRQIRMRAVVNAVTGTPRASLLKTVAALPRRRSARPSVPR